MFLFVIFEKERSMIKVDGTQKIDVLAAVSRLLCVASFHSLGFEARRGFLLLSLARLRLGTVS